MFFDEIVKDVTGQIEDLLRSEKNTILVVIEGMCGSGKSTLGEVLRRKYDCNLFHMDDFFLQPHQRTAERLSEVGGNVDYERFAEEILKPLQAGKTFSYGVFDCSRQVIGYRVQVPWKRLNIVEGAYSAHPYLGDSYDMGVFLELEDSLQQERLLKRNGPVILERFITEWIPKEKAYFDTFGIRHKCKVYQVENRQKVTSIFCKKDKRKNEEKGMVGLIVAYSKNRVIGNKGQIPWRIKGEQKRFRELTTGNVVIMGRRSYEEIGRPLPNRYTIVVSNTQKFEAENCTTAGSLEEAIAIADKTKNIYISGGAGLYKEAIDIVDKMFITEIDAVIEGDTFFPEFDESCFEKELECHVDGEIPYDYVTYSRKKIK